MFAQIVFDLLPLFMVLVLFFYFLAACADGQEAFQDFDSADQCSEEINFQGGDGDEDGCFNQDLAAPLAQRGHFIAEQEVREIQNFIGKGQGEEDHQDHNLPDKDRFNGIVFHGFRLVVVRLLSESRLYCS
jgi:hypothetical protein